MNSHISNEGAVTKHKDQTKQQLVTAGVKTWTIALYAVSTWYSRQEPIEKSSMLGIKRDVYSYPDLETAASPAYQLSSRRTPSKVLHW